MGKKYIPILLNSESYKIFIDNINKIYKVNLKKSKPIPPFTSKVFRKDSMQTNCQLEDLSEINY